MVAPPGSGWISNSRQAQLPIEKRTLGDIPSSHPSLSLITGLPHGRCAVSIATTLVGNFLSDIMVARWHYVKYPDRSCG